MSYGPGTPAFDRLDPRLQAIALKVVAESNGQVTISSGWRSNAHQQQLYNDWKAGRLSAPVVAKPGSSKHEHGGAIDFGGNLQLAQQLGRKYGLIFPVKGEAWHAELGDGVPEIDGEYAGQGGQFGIQYDLNYEGGGQESPEEVLANRMHAITRIMGLNPLDASSNADVMDEEGLNLEPAELDQFSPAMDMTMGMGGQFQSREVPTIASLDGENFDNVQYGKGNVGDYQRYAYSRLKQFGWSPKEMPALIELWNKESNWNPLAQNPTSTAFGIAQFLDGTWGGTGISKTTNPNRQIDAGLMYIKGRFKTPSAALAFHKRNNWY